MYLQQLREFRLKRPAGFCFPHVQPFIDAGRVTLRLCPNRNQLTNFMDTVRGLDISSYDLFAKIDDDDFYDPDYFRHVADFHALLPDGYSSCHRGEGLWLKRHEGYPYLEKSFLLALGPAQVMSRRVMEDLLAWETDRAAMKEAMYRCLRQTGILSIWLCGRSAIPDRHAGTRVC